MQDLGRLAADLLLFSMRELGFVSLPPALTTGSSIMPHKRNPDLLELVRGRTATAHACLAEALAITAKLPSGYHRDLQLLKAPLFRGLDLARDTAALLAATLPEVRFHRERIRLAPELFAAEEAYRLVLEEGVPFRDAYRRVAARYRGGDEAGREVSPTTPPGSRRARPARAGAPPARRGPRGR
jgi:argininosuccinate lyase